MSTVSYHIRLTVSHPSPLRTPFLLFHSPNNPVCSITVQFPQSSPVSYLREYITQLLSHPDMAVSQKRADLHVLTQHVVRWEVARTTSDNIDRDRIIKVIFCDILLVFYFDFRGAEMIMVHY